MASTGTLARPALKPGLHRRTDHASADRRLGYGLLAPAMAVFVAITGFPLVYNLWNSLHEVDLADPSASEFVGADNYTALFTDPEFLAALARTTVYTVVSVAVQTAIALGVALVLHKKFRGRGFVRAAVLIPWAVPTVVSAMIWKNIFDPRTGFLNYVLGALHLPGADTTWLAGPWTAWLAIFAADAWKTVPFTAIILLAGLQVIPDDIYEAGRVDGANAWQRFLHLTLPMLVPALMVVLIFRTISAFLIFDVVFIMTGGGPGETTETITYLNWKAFLVDLDFGAGAAISIVLVVLALLISAVYVKTLRPRV
jgi:ABC-type sugar transport system permease subunit